MKPEQTPSDLFSNETFLTAENPNKAPLSSRDEDLLSMAQERGTFDPEGDSIPELHKEQQLFTKSSRQFVKDNYSREVLAQERAEMAADSAKSSRNGAQVPLAKDVFADIITAGGYREIVRVAGHDWEIRAIEQSDLLCAADDVRDTSDGQLGYLTSFNFAKLIYAIEGVDGYSIYELLPDVLPAKFVNKIDYVIACKHSVRAYLLAFPTSVIDDLIEQHLRIEQAREDKLQKLKNS